MTNLRLSAAILIMTFAVSLVVTPVYAKPRESLRYLLTQNNGKHDQRFIDRERNEKRNGKRNQKRSDERIGRGRAASIARDATGGRVLKVELKGNTYRVKLLLAGERVRTVRVDANTGQLR